MTDAEIIVASLADGAVFEIIFRRHFDGIRRYVTRRVGNDGAADIIAEVFWRAFNGRKRYLPARPSALPWLFGIAGNVIREDLRRARVRARYDPLVLAREVRSDDPHAGVESRVDAAAFRTRLADALMQLGAVDREALMLQVVGELSHREIADALDIPIGTVKSRTFRALRTLRELVQDPDAPRPGGDDPDG